MSAAAPLPFERPGLNDTPEAWAAYFTQKSRAAIARGDERTAREYARFAVGEITFGRLVNDKPTSGVRKRA